MSIRTKKFEQIDGVAYVRKDIKEDEHIVSLGMDIDFLLARLEIKSHGRPRIISALSNSKPYSASEGNVKYERIAGDWYVVATKKIRDGQRLKITGDIPWFVTRTDSGNIV